MTANYELNLRRREAIKLQFRSEFAKALCSSDNPAEEFLFGGDTSKRVKEVAEVNKNKVHMKPRPKNMRGRGSPYSSCSWSRHSTVGYHQHIFWLSKPVFSEMCPSQRVWPTQTWYTKILQMLTHQPKLLLWTAETELLTHPQKKVHNMAGKLKLMACPISGIITESEAFQNMFQGTHRLMEIFSTEAVCGPSPEVGYILS